MIRTLRIRKEQMEAFAQAMREEFAFRMRAELRRQFPAETACHDDDVLAAIVHAGIDQAAALGIVLETDVARFLEFGVCYGSQWQTDPQVGEILRDSKLTGTQKMDRIDLWEQFGCVGVDSSGSQGNL